MSAVAVIDSARVRDWYEIDNFTDKGKIILT